MQLSHPVPCSCCFVCAPAWAGGWTPACGRGGRIVPLARQLPAQLCSQSSAAASPMVGLACASSLVFHGVLPPPSSCFPSSLQNCCTAHVRAAMAPVTQTPGYLLLLPTGYLSHARPPGCCGPCEPAGPVVKDRGADKARRGRSRSMTVMRSLGIMRHASRRLLDARSLCEAQMHA